MMKTGDPPVADRPENEDPAVDDAPPAPPEEPGAGSDVKQRYESNEAVQRWIRQGEGEVDAEPATPDSLPDELRFDPRFLANHRDRAWILSSLGGFHAQGLITDVLGDVRPGKEATVYCCRAHPRTGEQLLAAKIYRPRMFRSLKNDAAYRRNRHTAHDARQDRAMRRKTRRGRQFQVEKWIEYEFEAHQTVYAAGAEVPRPWAQEGNSVLMGFVGEPGAPAPHLREVDIEAAEARELFERLVDNVRLCLACNVIHGDLSAFNILYWDGQVTIIDFAQAVDPRTGSESMSFLHRDVERLCDFFRPLGVDASAGDITARLWEDFLRGRL
jgi:RIO kinase 1